MRRLAIIALPLTIGLPACGASSTGLSSTPYATTPALVSIHLASQDWLTLGAYGVGNIGCDGRELAWTTSSKPISKLNSNNDLVEVSDQENVKPMVAASATHGGDLTDAVPITGKWLVYMEYRQREQSSTLDFWYLNAVDWTTGQTIALASATNGPQLLALPWYDASNGLAVWDQLDSASLSVLRVHDFASGKTITLSLPVNMYPVQPTVSNGAIVFVDNSTDPNRAHEDFFGQRGSLRSYDLKTGSTTTLSDDPTAWMPRARGGEVTWTIMPTAGAIQTAAMSTQGGAVTALGGSPVTPMTNGSTVFWYDSHDLRFIAYRLSDHRRTNIQVGAWPDLRSVFALCGNKVFFALPEALEGSSVIRYINLPGA